MKFLLLAALIFSTPEYPAYTSEVCMLAFSETVGATYEVHVGTSAGVYDTAVPVPLNRTAISCEDMGITPQSTEVTYYRRVLARLPDGSVTYYGDMPPMVVAAIRPEPPQNFSVMLMLSRLFSW